MKMISDVDMYYDRMSNRVNKPQWMLAERMDYCDKAVSLKKDNIIDHITRLFAKN